MLKTLFSPHLAGNSLIAILSATLIFHLLIIAGIIPYSYTWGGQLESREQMLVFETFSILITLLVIAVVAIKLQYLNWSIKPILITAILWILCGIFVLNTLGNLIADNNFERFLGTAFTVILAFLCGRLAIEKGDPATQGRLNKCRLPRF